MLRKLNSRSVSRRKNPVRYVGRRDTGLRSKSSKIFAVGMTDDQRILSFVQTKGINIDFL